MAEQTEISLKHKELIAAITSGIIILLAWRMESIDSTFAAVIAYLSAYVIGGYAKAKAVILDTIQSKSLNIEGFMLLAAICSALIGYWIEGAILIFIFAMRGVFETYALNKMNDTISSLANLLPEEAWLVRGGFAPIKVAATSLVKNDHILVQPGERIPADGFIYKGETTVNEAVITGDSEPVSKIKNSEVFAGTVNLSDTITVNVTKANSDLQIQKIINYVQKAQSEKSPSQLYLEKFGRTYVKVLLLAVIALILLSPYLLNWDWSTSFYRGIVLLVVASPCAVVASITPTVLAAIANGAKMGMLFKSGAHLARLSHVNIIAVAALQDSIRPETKETIAQLKSLGIDVIMFTDDNETTAQAVSKQVGVSSFKANCTPTSNVEHIKHYLDEGKIVALLDDDVNDDSILTTASVGIVMNKGTDIARKTADVVLMKNDLTKLANSVLLAKKSQSIMKQNIIFSLSIITLLVILNFFQIINLSFGVIVHEVSTILVILNGLRLLKS